MAAGSAGEDIEASNIMQGMFLAIAIMTAYWVGRLVSGLFTIR